MYKNSFIDKYISNPLKDLSFGYSTLVFFSPTELENAQIGYSINNKGNLIIGEKPGDWKIYWLVIGYDELDGDPIFVDVNSDVFPIFSAEHGQGVWNPIPISSSFESFCSTLNEIRNIAHGRENPISLEKKPLSAKVKDNVLQKIRLLNPNLDIFYWENFINNSVDI
jgi:hypothetical protein